MKRLFLLTAMATGLVIAPPTLAGDTTCVGTLTGSFDNVIVLPGTDCTLLNSFVMGNVKNYGSLGVNRSIVGGNVEGEPGNHHTAVFNLSFVRGNVTIKGATNAAFGSGVFASTVGGDVEYVESMGNRLDLFFSTIGGNVKSEKNVGGGFIVSNTINGNLECKENTPPHSNTGNTVRGNNKCPE